MVACRQRVKSLSPVEAALSPWRTYKTSVTRARKGDVEVDYLTALGQRGINITRPSANSRWMGFTTAACREGLS